MSVVTEASHGKRRVTLADVWAKAPEPLSVGVRSIDNLESIALGFRAEMFSLKDENGNGGELLTSAGFGGESIILEFKDGKSERLAVVRGTDLLIAWIAKFDPATAVRMRAAVA